MGVILVSDVINGASQDIRRLLDSSVQGSTDVATLIDYTNRIQLQLLREARWRFLISPVLQITTAIGTSDYWIGPVGGNAVGQVDTGLNLTNIGTVKMGTVFDRTNFRRLSMTDEAPVGPSFTGNGRPQLYRNDISSPSVFSIYPAADNVYTVQFRYFFQKPQLKSTTDVLLIPDDYKDVVIAGVNFFANAYLRENKQDAQMWQQIYASGIEGMHRDHNLFPRGQEFISPDPASTPRTVTIPIGLDSGIETSLP